MSGLLGRARRLAGLFPIRRVAHAMAGLENTIRSFQSLWFQLASAYALGADAVIRPDLERFWFLGFGQAREIMAAGEEAAEAGLADLRRALRERIGWQGSG